MFISSVGWSVWWFSSVKPPQSVWWLFLFKCLCAADSPTYLVTHWVVDPFFSRRPWVGGEHGFSLTHKPVFKAFLVQILCCLPRVWLALTRELGKGNCTGGFEPSGKSDVWSAQALRAGQTPSRTTTLFTLENVQSCWRYAITSVMFF